MAFYLRQENGDKIILEQGGGFLILAETSPPATSVIYGGDDAPRKRKKHKPRADIYRDIQDTIHALVEGEPEAVPVDTATVASSDASTALERQVDRAMARLVALSQERQQLAARVTALQREIASYQQWLLDEDEADWEWFL